MSAARENDWASVLGGLGPGDWQAAEADAGRRERRRLRFGHLSLLLLVIVGAGVAILRDRPTVTPLSSRGKSQDPAARLVAALESGESWSSPGSSDLQRAQAPFEIYALAQAQLGEVSEAWRGALGRACERLLVREQAPGGATELSELISACALLHSGRVLDDHALFEAGRSRLEAAARESARVRPAGRPRAWMGVAQTLVSSAPSRRQLLAALGGSSGVDPAWRTASLLLVPSP